MIERSVHGDVTAYRLSWWRSRLIGYGVHVFVVRKTMIDTGFPAARREVEGIVRAEHVHGVIVTHEHEDHAGNIPWLADRGMPIAMPAQTHEALKSAHRIGLYRHVTWQAMPTLHAAITPFDDATLSLVHAPGHSSDHHVVWDHSTGTVFAGDLFLGVRVKLAHSYEQPFAHLRSLRAVITRQPSRVFCAHRGLLPDGVRLLTAKADWIEQTIEKIRARAARGTPADHIRAELLGRRDSTHWFSFGDYSPDNFVRAVLRDLPNEC